MSYYARSKENGNSAVLVNVYPEDFKTDNVLGGIDFQEKLNKERF